MHRARHMFAMELRDQDRLRARSFRTRVTLVTFPCASTPFRQRVVSSRSDSCRNTWMRMEAAGVEPAQDFNRRYRRGQGVVACAYGCPAGAPPRRPPRTRRAAGAARAVRRRFPIGEKHRRRRRAQGHDHATLRCAYFGSLTELPPIDSPATLGEWHMPWPAFEVDWRRAALLVVDMQNYGCNSGVGIVQMLSRRYPEIARYYLPAGRGDSDPELQRLLAAFRHASGQIVFTRHGPLLADGRDMIARRRRRDTESLPTRTSPRCGVAARSSTR